MSIAGLRIAIVAAAAVLATSLCTPAFAAQRATDGAVTIRAFGPVEDGIGSGTIVAQNGSTIRILTAKHVATYGALSVRFDDGTRVPAKLIEAFPDRDLAVVEATVPAAFAATLHPATLAAARPHGAIHVWGSGFNGPAFETGVVGLPGADLPDGAARGRFAINCNLCHEGDSGGGVFDGDGNLVGVYIGYFEAGAARISVAESALAAALAARTLPFANTLTIAVAAPPPDSDTATELTSSR